MIEKSQVMFQNNDKVLGVVVGDGAVGKVSIRYI